MPMNHSTYSAKCKRISSAVENAHLQGVSFMSYVGDKVKKLQLQIQKLINFDQLPQISAVHQVCKLDLKDDVLKIKCANEADTIPRQVTKVFSLRLRQR